MKLKLYKPGQGYWTRMLSGVGAGIFSLAGVAWMWDQLSRLSSENALYVQASVAVIMIAVLGLLFYWLIGVNERTSDFLIVTEGEMKKVNWPTRKEIFGSTWVVIVFLFLLVAVLFTVDLLFALLFRSIGVLAG